MAEAGQGIGGDWQDHNSNTYKAMRHAADRFQKELHMSGDNIAAALAVGLRESGFNPKAVNPGGAVKGFGNGVLVELTVIVIKIRRIMSSRKCN
ncbi:phage tail tip lysozyme [Leuconostoc citreum]